MRKFLLTFTLLCTMFASSLSAGNKQVILNPRPKSHQGDKTPKPRTPMVIPDVYIDDYTLTFDESCIGCPLTLIDEDDNIVYTTIIDETGIVELPDTLSGIFEIEIERGSITFVGEIEL